jgi:hypothetical protein
VVTNACLFQLTEKGDTFLDTLLLGCLKKCRLHSVSQGQL